MKVKIPDKYALYEAAVQDPPSEMSQLASIYRRHRRQEARFLREDFCGSFVNSAEWVRRSPENKAVAVDQDLSPLTYGFENHYSRLTMDQQKRLTVAQKNVVHLQKPNVDLLAALNFSYSVFKEETQLLRYFQNAFRSLKPDGVFVLDLMGGSELMEANEDIDEKKLPDGKPFTYIWDQVSFDILSHHAEFYIHFKLKNGRTLRRAFHYDWRLWTIPEVRALMGRAGFRKTVVYCEGTTRAGEGNGRFSAKEREEGCEVWVVYVVGLK